MSIRAPILYYFPGLKTIPAEFADRERSRAGGNPHGPDDARGAMMSPGSGSVVYEPARQHWEKVREDLWIGIDQDFDPGEFAIDRKNRATPITLGDGRSWSMPCLNPISPRVSLPTCDKLLMGEWARVVRPGHTELVEHCQNLIGTLAESTVSESTITIETEVCRPLIAAALAYHYDLTLLELSCIGIFAHEIYWGAIAIITDFDAIQAAAAGAAMEAGEGLNPTDGEQDSSPTSHGELDTPSPTNTTPASSTST